MITYIGLKEREHQGQEDGGSKKEGVDTYNNKNNDKWVNQ